MQEKDIYKMHYKVRIPRVRREQRDFITAEEEEVHVRGKRRAKRLEFGDGQWGLALSKERSKSWKDKTKRRKQFRSECDGY